MDGPRGQCVKPNEPDTERKQIGKVESAHLEKRVEQWGPEDRMGEQGDGAKGYKVQLSKMNKFWRAKVSHGGHG